MTGQPATQTPLEEFAGLSPDAMAQIRNRWIATAYERLPGLTLQERALARDRMLAAECSMWRVRFREADKELTHQRFRADQAEAMNRHLNERIEYLLELVNSPPESPGVSS